MLFFPHRCLTERTDPEVLCALDLVSPLSAGGKLWACLWRNTLWSIGLWMGPDERAPTGSGDTQPPWVSPYKVIFYHNRIMLDLSVFVVPTAFGVFCIKGSQHHVETLTRICCSGCSSWSSRLPLTDPDSSVQTGSSLSLYFCPAPSSGLSEMDCQRSTWWFKTFYKI